MIIAVTGSSGFIGSYLVPKIIEAGHDIIEIDSRHGFDLTKEDDLKNINKFDCLIHLAGKVSVIESLCSPYEYLKHNYLCTLNALQLCKKFKAKIIFASSNIYGTPNYLPVNENHPVSVTNAYTQSKIISEQLCQFYCNNYNISGIGLRQFNIYGERMNANSLIPTILKQVTSGTVRIKDSRPRRDYVHIDDVITAYVKSIEYEPQTFEIFNIASGKSYYIKDIINICEDIVGKEIELVDLGEARVGEVQNIEVDIQKAQNLLGWKPQVGFSNGINSLLGYYTQQLPLYETKIESPKVNYIPLSVPSFTGNEWKYIKTCLDTEWVSTAGKYVDEFELKIAEFTGSKYAVACVNGTSALHISLLLSGVKPDDEVIVPTLTFIAPINSVRYCNAHPVFMDADKYYNIDVVKTIDFILNETEVKTIILNGTRSEFTFNKKTGKRISAIIPVHVFGNAVFLDDLHKVCIERNIRIIEDATESLGTIYNSGAFKGKHTGTIGEFGCLSFNGNKIITTGGGGMILTNDENMANKAKYLTTQAKDDEARFIHNAVGYNYRLTNLLAALGLAQLEKLGSYIEIKKKNYGMYKENINGINGLHLAETPDYAENNHWLYSLQVEKTIYGKDIEELRVFLEANNIQTRPVWYLNHLQKEYKDCLSYCIENALSLHQKTLNIPSSANLRKEDIERIVGILDER